MQTSQQLKKRFIAVPWKTVTIFEQCKPKQKVIITSYAIWVVVEFLGNVFTDFIFEKLLSNEALVTGRVTATSNNQTQLYN